MCDLCSSDKTERRAAISRNKNIADRLRELARDLDRLSHGSIQPHTDEAKTVGLKATSIIRELVQDWL